MALKKESSSEWGGSVFDTPIPIIETEVDLCIFVEAKRDYIPNSVKVKLAVPNTGAVPCPEVGEGVGCRSIKFHPFMIALRFEFPRREVMFWMDCALAQLTPNSYKAIICFEKMTNFFDLHLTVAEFFFFFRVRRDGKYTQLKAKHRLFVFMPKGEHKWKEVTLLISGNWDGANGDGTPKVPNVFCRGQLFFFDLQLIL